MAYKFVPYAPEGSGGDSIVVDVPELPTENVDDGKIYRSVEEVEELYSIVVFSNGQPLDYIAMMESMMEQYGLSLSVTKHIVDSLPEEMEESYETESAQVLHLYFVKSTGEVYMNSYGTVGNLMTQGALGPWHGIIHDYSEATETGCYTLMREGSVFTVYGVPNQQETKYVCEYRADGAWTNTTKEAAKVPDLKTKIDGLNAEVETLNAEVETLNAEVETLNAEVETLNTEIDSLTTENSSLRTQLNSNTGATNFVKYAVMEATEEGVALKNVDSASVDSITFPDSIVTLQSNSLTSCGASLKNIVWGKGIKHLHSNVFGSGVLSANTVLENLYVSDLKSWLNMEVYGNTSDYAHPLGSLTNGSASYIHFYVGDELVTNLIIPDGISNIINHSFSNCRDIRSVTFPTSVTTIGREAFQYTTLSGALVIPDGVTVIGDDAFRNVYANLKDSDDGLISVTFGTGLQTIGSSAFGGNSKLRTVTFKSTPTAIGGFSAAFQNCTNITDIYVPWSEGEVAGAPWGAPSTCTIHYNHTT